METDEADSRTGNGSPPSREESSVECVPIRNILLLGQREGRRRSN